MIFMSKHIRFRSFFYTEIMSKPDMFAHMCSILMPVAIACRLFYRFSHNVRETSKTNKGVWKETTESSSTLQFIMRGHREKA